MVLWILPEKPEHDHPTLTGVDSPGPFVVRYFRLPLSEYNIHLLKLNKPATAPGGKDVIRDNDALGSPAFDTTVFAAYNNAEERNTNIAGHQY
jgi:hypothetical protein